VFEVEKCKVCKRPIAVVKAIGKIRSQQIGNYCFKCKRLVLDKEKVKTEGEFI
jgi:hypothetical protein